MEAMLSIKDATDDAQQLPLAHLLEFVRGLASQSSTWTITSANGYGKDICSLEDALDKEVSMVVEPLELIRICRDENQWFYDLRCFDESLEMSFGIVDSTALFVEGEKRICDKVAAEFEDVEYS